MKFVLFAEGHSERKALPRFLKRWLDSHLSNRVGIQPVRFDGWAQMARDLPVKSKLHLSGPGSDDVIAVIALLDLYGPTFYPSHAASATDRLQWAIGHFQRIVSDPRFRMYFAVHELEAWLLSQPTIFPKEIQKAFPDKIAKPEVVNFDEHPKKLLERLYREKLKKKYKEVADGVRLFSNLDPEETRSKCPEFKKMMDELLQLAKSAGL